MLSNWIGNHSRVKCVSLFEAAGSIACTLQTIWCCLYHLNSCLAFPVMGRCAC